jgi:hypothetical protein
MASQVNKQLMPLPAAGLPVRTTAPAPSTGTSTGTKVAVGAAAVAGGLTLTTLLASAITGYGVSKVLDVAWDKIRGKKTRK